MEESGRASAAGDGGVGVPLRRDARFANRPYGVRGVGDATRVGGGGAPPRATGYRLSPVRRWGVRAGERWSLRRGVPLRRDGRFASRPYDGVWGVGNATGARGGGGPRHAPLDTGFRR